MTSNVVLYNDYSKSVMDLESGQNISDNDFRCPARIQQIVGKHFSDYTRLRREGGIDFFSQTFLIAFNVLDLI